MDKQKILNIIIIISIIAIIGIIGWIIYEHKNNSEMQNTISTNVQENEVEESEPVQEEKEELPQEEVDEPVEEEKEQEQEYIGKEEVDSKEETTEQTPEEKAIQLAKTTWGEDKDVIFNIEEKKGNVYYVAVKSNASVLLWYEINTDTWEISEFY